VAQPRCGAVSIGVTGLAPVMAPTTPLYELVGVDALGGFTTAESKPPTLPSVNALFQDETLVKATPSITNSTQGTKTPKTQATKHKKYNTKNMKLFRLPLF